MTIDRDRVEAAWAEWISNPENVGRMAEVIFKDGWQAAADALAPPPAPLDREAVAKTFRHGYCGPGYQAVPWHDLSPQDRRFWLDGADAVLALLPAAPPSVPEDVRRAHDAWSGDSMRRNAGSWVLARGAYFDILQAWVEQLLALPAPAPPAETGDVVQIETRVEELAKRDADRICELEGALRGLFGIINVSVFVRATDGLPAAMERARAVLLGVDTVQGGNHGRD